MKERPQGSLRARLASEHDELDAFLDRLIAAFRTGDRGEAGDAYEELEWRLRDHFAFEEESLFEEFARTEPAETEALRREHVDLVARLEALGVGVDLHETRLGEIEELAQLLRRHATREDALLYRWADQAFADLDRRPDLGTSHVPHPGA